MGNAASSTAARSTTPTHSIPQLHPTVRPPSQANVPPITNISSSHVTNHEERNNRPSLAAGRRWCDDETVATTLTEDDVTVDSATEKELEAMHEEKDALAVMKEGHALAAMMHQEEAYAAQLQEVETTQGASPKAAQQISELENTMRRHDSKAAELKSTVYQELQVTIEALRDCTVRRVHIKGAKMTPTTERI